MTKEKNFTKPPKKYGALLETKTLYDNQVGQWIYDRLQAAQFKIDAKTLQILSEALGNDLSKIEKEIGKLKIVLDEENPKSLLKSLNNMWVLVKTTIISNSTRLLVSVTFFNVPKL